MFFLWTENKKQVVFPSDCRCLEMKTNWPRGTPSNTFSFVFSLSPISLFVVLGTHLTIYLLEMDQDFKFAHFLGCFWSQKRTNHTLFSSLNSQIKRDWSSDQKALISASHHYHPLQFITETKHGKNKTTMRSKCIHLFL